MVTKENKKKDLAYKEIYPAIYDKFRTEYEKCSQVESKSGMVLTFCAILAALLGILFSKIPLLHISLIFALIAVASLLCLLNFYPINIQAYDIQNIGFYSPVSINQIDTVLIPICLVNGREIILEPHKKEMKRCPVNK